MLHVLSLSGPLHLADDAREWRGVPCSIHYTRRQRSIAKLQRRIIMNHQHQSANAAPGAPTVRLQGYDVLLLPSGTDPAAPLRFAPGNDVGNRRCEFGAWRRICGLIIYDT